MASLLHGLPARSRPADGVWSAARAAAALAALASTLLAAGALLAYTTLPLAVAVFAALWIVALSDWRKGLLALGLFLPFSGLPVFALSTPYAPVLKDVLLVLPLYISFAIESVARRRRMLPERDVAILVALAFAAVAVAYLARSSSALAGAIGLKVWIAYLPMYLIGYHFAAEELENVVRFLKITVALALVPVTIGLVELVQYLRSGDFGPLMGLYGRFEDEIVQEVGLGQSVAGPFPRIPSTFTFAGSYYNFLLVAFAAALALWWYRRGVGTWLLAALYGAAALLSGTRRAYLTIPLVLLLPVVLGRVGVSTRVGAAAAGVLAIGLMTLFGLEAAGLAGAIFAQTPAYGDDLLTREFLPALQDGPLGAGTGANTNAAFRYAGVTPGDAGWREGWYTKAIVEWGALGLVALALVVALLWRGWTALRAVSPPARALALPLLAMLAATAFTLVKASELDWDPMNVYFFLIAGLIAGIGVSGRPAQSRE